MESDMYPCIQAPIQREQKAKKSGRSENGVSFLTYLRFPSSHTTVRAVRHTAVSCLSCPFWTPHIGHRHFFSIVGIRPIVLKREFLFGHLTTTFPNTQIVL